MADCSLTGPRTRSTHCASALFSTLGECSPCFWRDSAEYVVHIDVAVSLMDVAVSLMDVAVVHMDVAVVHTDVAVSLMVVAVAHMDVAVAQMDVAVVHTDVAVAQMDVAVSLMVVAVAQMDVAVSLRGISVILRGISVILRGVSLGGAECGVSVVFAEWHISRGVDPHSPLYAVHQGVSSVPVDVHARVPPPHPGRNHHCRP